MQSNKLFNLFLVLNIGFSSAKFYIEETENITTPGSTEIEALLDYNLGLILYRDDTIPACFVENYAFDAYELPESDFTVSISSEAISLVQEDKNLTSQFVTKFCGDGPLYKITGDAFQEGFTSSARQKRQVNGNYRNLPSAEARANWNYPGHGQASQTQVQGQVFGRGFFSGQAQSQNGGLSQSQVQLSGVGVTGQIASSSGNAQSQLSLGGGAGSGQASGLGDGPSNSQVQINLGGQQGQETMASASATSGTRSLTSGFPGHGTNFPASSSGGFRENFYDGSPIGPSSTGTGGLHYPQGSETRPFVGSFQPQPGSGTGISPQYAGSNYINQHPSGGGGSGIHHGAAPSTQFGHLNGPGGGIRQPSLGLHQGADQQGWGHHVGAGHNGHADGTGAPAGQEYGRESVRQGTVFNGIGTSGHPFTSQGFESGRTINGIRDQGIRLDRRPPENGGSGFRHSIAPQVTSITRTNGHTHRDGSTTVGRPYSQSSTPGAQASSYGLGQAQAQTVYFGNVGNGQYLPISYDQTSHPGGPPTGQRFQDQQVGLGAARQTQQTGSAGWSQNGSYRQNGVSAGSTGAHTGTDHLGQIAHGHQTNGLRNGHGRTQPTNGATASGGPTGSGYATNGVTGRHSIPHMQLTYPGRSPGGDGVSVTTQPTGFPSISPDVQQNQIPGISGGIPGTVPTSGSGHTELGQTAYQRPTQSPIQSSRVSNGGGAGSGNGYKQLHQRTTVNGRNGQSAYRINGHGQIIPAGYPRQNGSPSTTITAGGVLEDASGQNGFSPSYGVSQSTPDDPNGKKCTIITFSCTIIIESNGRAKICKPNAVRMNGGAGFGSGGTSSRGTQAAQICCC